jgi:restriction endonuclease Mrr
MESPSGYCETRKTFRGRLPTSTPKVQPLLLPVLRAIADGAEHGVERIRERVAEELRLTKDELTEIHRKSGQNVYANRVAFALAYFNVGKAITTSC